MIYQILMIYITALLMSCSGPIDDSHTQTSPDLIGDWYLPLANLTYDYQYNFRSDTSKFDFEIQNVSVNISKYNNEEYSYGFSNSNESILLMHVSQPIQKAGTYYSGYINKDTVVLLDTLSLYIPQIPQKNQKWTLWNNHTMQVIAIDTMLYLDLNADNNPSDSLDLHKVAVYSETWGDWEIIHYYKQRVGLVAQQRNYQGHLMAWGQLNSW